MAFGGQPRKGQAKDHERNDQKPHGRLRRPARARMVKPEVPAEEQCPHRARGHGGDHNLCEGDACLRHVTKMILARIDPTVL